jgi:hypothetical protein
LLIREQLKTIDRTVAWTVDEKTLIEGKEEVRELFAGCP